MRSRISRSTAETNSQAASSPKRAKTSVEPTTSVNNTVTNASDSPNMLPKHREHPFSTQEPPASRAALDSATSTSPYQRGISRPQGPGCEIGGVEVQVTLPTPVPG